MLPKNKNFTLTAISKVMAFKKFRIIIIYILVDFLAIFLSTITAYQFRLQSLYFFPSVEQIDLTFNYKIFFIFVILGWLLTFMSTGIYSFNHANLFVLNVQNVLKRSIYFFFILGFISFITKILFSRILFLVMLISGLIYLFIGRIIAYFLLIRPLILNKKISFH